MALATGLRTLSPTSPEGDIMSTIIVSPSGLSTPLIRFRSLTAPALVVSASGLIPRRAPPIGVAALVVQKITVSPSDVVEQMACYESSFGDSIRRLSCGCFVTRRMTDTFSCECIHACESW